MNHNPFNLQIGTWVVLDKRPKEPVWLFNLSPLTQMFAEVGCYEARIDTWQVMTNRLEPLSNYPNIKHEK